MLQRLFSLGTNWLCVCVSVRLSFTHFEVKVEPWPSTSIRWHFSCDKADFYQPGKFQSDSLLTVCEQIHNDNCGPHDPKPFCVCVCVCPHVCVKKNSSPGVDLRVLSDSSENHLMSDCWGALVDLCSSLSKALR